MRKKILVRGPFLSQSGYGAQAMFALHAIKSQADKFEVFLINTGWGATSWVTTDNKERKWIDETIQKTIRYVNEGGEFDIFLQVSIPNEAAQCAPVNILYTAGIETSRVAPVWIEKSALFDNIIVVSNHSKNVYLNTSYLAKDTRTGAETSITCQTPIDVVNYPVDQPRKKEVTLDLEYDFNFLCMAQWGPRKNLANTVKWFVEEFIDQEVGLVVKTSIANNCHMDKVASEERLRFILNEYKDMKCKVYLLHGNMTRGEVYGLYNHPKIKSLVSLTHGECAGLPLFEAAGAGLPVIVPGWSGQADFLYVDKKPMFSDVKYSIAQIQPEAVWEGVLEAESQWAFPEQGSYKMNLRDMYKNYDVHLETAVELQTYLKKNFTKRKMYGQFVDAVLKPFVVTKDEIDNWLDEIVIHD